MRYLTRDVLQGSVSDAEARSRVQSYEARLTSLEGVIPSRAIELGRRWDLHDSVVVSIRGTNDEEEFHLGLICGDQETGYKHLLVAYHQAVIDEPSLRLVKEACRNRAFEILAQEIDISDSGAKVIHRLLFWPHGEFSVQCQDLSWNEKSVESRFPD